jgi:hypothetical protein
MAGIIGQPDDPAALARLLSSLSQRVARLETQNRLRDATIDMPGMLRVRDEAGVVRFALGRFDDNGGIGTRQYSPTGAPLAAAEQASGTDPRTISSTSYVDAGPAQSATVTAGPSGSLLVILTALISGVERTVTSTGFMTFASAGGRTTAALDVNALEYSEPLADAQTEAASAGHTHGQAGELVAGGDHTHLIYPAMGPPAARPFRGSRVVLLNGCDPTQPVVVTAKYRVSAASGPYIFDDRTLIVVPL